MKLYKLKIEFPNSPKIGSVIVHCSDDYYKFKPHEYKELWEEFESSKTIISADGFILAVGSKCYIVDLYNNTKFSQSFILETTNLNDESLQERLYSEIENAKSACINNINLTLQDGEVKGVDVPLYGVCTTSPNMQKAETTSLMFSQKDSQRRSDKWIWFKSEQNRDKFIDMNIRNYSKKDFITIIDDFCDNYINNGTEYEPQRIKNKFKEFLL